MGLPVLRTLSLCTCRRHYPGAASERIVSLISSRRISLPRKGCRVDLRIVLFEACSAFTRVAACTLALSPIRDTLIEGFSHFVLRLLPAGAIAGWGLHPLESAAFARRTPVSDMSIAGHRPTIVLYELFSFPEPRGCILSSEHVERRLAAILAADVVGSCRLIGFDEEGTLGRLRALRKSLFDPKITDHRGRIVKNTGDGALVEFASVVDAVRCADEIQRGVAEQNTDVPQDKRIELRIGIHVGDIIIEENDIFGDGVNIAVRLEGIAEPGGICISDDTYRHIRGKVDIAFEDMGPQSLKHITDPMRAS